MSPACIVSILSEAPLERYSFGRRLLSGESGGLPIILSAGKPTSCLVLTLMDGSERTFRVPMRVGQF